MSSRPTTLRWTKAQEDAIIEIANRLGIPQSNVLRNALDWYLALTSYNQETMDLLQKVHPEMNPGQIVAWLMFRWRLDHEGKNGREEKTEKIISLCNEILSILKGVGHESTTKTPDLSNVVDPIPSSLARTPDQ